MKKSLITVAILTSLLFINSCDDETPSTISGGGRIKFDISIFPPVGGGQVLNVGIGNNPMAISGTAGYSGEMTDEYAVTKGQNFPIKISYPNPEIPPLVNICRTITIDAILNGSVIDTKVLEMGFKGSTSAIEYCKDNVNKTINYIIP